MSPRKLIALASALGLAGAASSYARFRREMREIDDVLDSGSDLVAIGCGQVEFACEGKGSPVLMIHGAGGGYDQGLAVGRDVFDTGYRVIAPSRFGYLRSTLPEDASPAAQADVHAALLDRLGVGSCIVAGVSAGAPSAIELALRHPEKVSALVLLVPRTYDPATTVGVERNLQNEAILRMMESASDFLYWLAVRFARPAIVRFLGVPPCLEEKVPAEERQRVSEIMQSILPLSRRVAGLRADSATVLSEWPLERVEVPTLVISAKDDLFHTLPGAQFTAKHIRGAELHVLENGGHLMVGRGEEVRRVVADFLERTQRLPEAA